MDAKDYLEKDELNIFEQQYTDKFCEPCVKLWSRRLVDARKQLAAARKRIAELEGENERKRNRIKELEAYIEEYYSLLIENNLIEPQEVG